MKPSGYLSKSGGLTNDENQAVSLGSGIHSIAAADLNADGLVDLVAGKPNSQLAWLPNKGTKEQPKFETPSNLTGDKPSPVSWSLPSQWDVDIGESRGNFFAYVNSVTAQEDTAAQPAEGARALKFGFAAAQGNPLAKVNFPGSKEFVFGDYRANHLFYDLPLSRRLIGAPSRTFMMQQQIQLEVGKPYTFSFQYKGSGMAKAKVYLGWWGFKELSAATVTRGARGAAQVQYNHANETDQIVKDLRASSAWTTFSETFTIKFKNKDLKDQKLTHKAIVIIAFELEPPDGFLYLDDLKLVPQG